MSVTLGDLTNANVKTVTVCGLKFKAQEFDMQTRQLWIQEVRDHNLDEMQRKLQTEIIPEVAAQPKAIENDPHMKSINARYVKLMKRHEKLLEMYGSDDEPEDIDEQLNDVIERMSELSDQLEVKGHPRAKEAIEVAREGEIFIEEYMRLQDEVRMKFIWKLATAAGKTDLSFDDFRANAKSADYDAAEEFVMLGNAGWVERMANRATRRATQQNQTGTLSTAKQSQQEFDPTNSPN